MVSNTDKTLNKLILENDDEELEKQLKQDKPATREKALIAIGYEIKERAIERKASQEVEQCDISPRMKNSHLRHASAFHEAGDGCNALMRAEL